MEGKRGSECLLKSVSNIDFNPKFYDETNGTYHAPGSNPDGTPDAWVQGQDEWLAQHPEYNNVTVQPDGTVTQDS